MNGSTMHATSASQFEASGAATIPPLEQVRERVWAVGADMPGGHIPYSLLYMVQDSSDGIHVIDPGWDSDRNWEALISSLSAIGSDVTAVRSITATHLHPDHIGMAQRLRLHTDAPVQVHALEKRDLDAAGAGGWTPSVLAHELDEWLVPSDRRNELEQMLAGAPPRPTVDVDRVIQENERLEIPGFDLIAMLTPGHTSGSLTLRDDHNELLFTGDVLIPTMHAGLGLGGNATTNSLHDYLVSLDALRRFPGYEALPGHGYRFTGVPERANQSAAHHLRRTREVAEALEGNPDASIWEIARNLTWTAGWKNLSGFYVYSALKQTAMHRDYLERYSK
jgi:glyoxylase-like metal-dependent hydrolase (beta-lactamase superfamily II)